MKLVCVILSFTVLLTGCYSSTLLTPKSPHSSSEVTFTLKDNTFVLSTNCERVEGGYKVVGERINMIYSTKVAFSGIIVDEQIRAVEISEFDEGTTILAILLPVILVGFMTGSYILINGVR